MIAVITTPVMHPMKIPMTPLLTVAPLPFLPLLSKPHIQGKNCVYVKMLKMTACPANARSLNSTVGVRPWLRSAYCSLMTGEYRNATFDVKYARKPSTLMRGKSIVVPEVDFLRKLSRG
jgi:hypothetical protein